MEEEKEVKHITVKITFEDFNDFNSRIRRRGLKQNFVSAQLIKLYNKIDDVGLTLEEVLDSDVVEDWREVILGQ